MAEPRTLEPEQWELWHAWMQAHRLLNRELDRDLQREYGITKAEFSVLVTLHQAPDGQMRVGELAESLDWQKSRVAHQLTRMENRELVYRTDHESNGRRTAIGLTAKGRNAAQHAILGHADNIRRYFFQAMTPDHAAAIHEWSRRTIDRIESNDTTATSGSTAEVSPPPARPSPAPPASGPDPSRSTGPHTPDTPTRPSAAAARPRPD